MVNSSFEKPSIAPRSVAARAPSVCSANPLRIAITSTCRMSPRANASNIDTGMTFSK
jgi:hypothetical protein